MNIANTRFDVGTTLYVKGIAYPVIVTDLDNSGFLVKDHRGELLDFTLKDLGRVIFFSKDDDIYKFQDTGTSGSMWLNHHHSSPIPQYGNYPHRAIS